MKECYLCGNEFNSSTVVNHAEHIIQQAIGGSLTDDNILCQNCGTQLSVEIDTPFNEIFSGIATMLDIKKDRKSNKSRSVTGKVVSKIDSYGNDLSGVIVVWKDFKVSPVTPFYRYIGGNKVVIYAGAKEYRNYLKKVNKEMESNGKGSKPEIVHCDDIVGFVEYEFPMNNIAFKKGLAKIAIGFASSRGIARENFPFVLDIQSNRESKIKNEIPLIQYAPLGEIDIEMEKSKSEIRYFPMHTLILFTSASNPSVLVCYIELFSTFQWYVVLTENYNDSPVYEFYCQRLKKESDYIFEPGRRYYKERNIHLNELGISEDRIKEAYEKRRTTGENKKIEDVEFDIVKQEYIKQKYKIELEEEVKILVDLALENFSNNISSSKGENKIEELYNNMQLYYSGGDQFNISGYRRCYVDGSQRHDYLTSLLKLRQENPEQVKQHGFFRFNQLSKFIQLKGIRRKLER